MRKLSFALIATVFFTACNAYGTKSNPPAPYSAGERGSRVGPASLRVDAVTLTEESVTYQVNAQHTGYAASTLRPPLTTLWSVKLGDRGSGVGYPVVANGIVVVEANNRLVALDAMTGKIRWSKGSRAGWVGPAYENGTIFSDPVSTSFGDRKFGMYAFDERSGKLRWAKSAPREWSFSSPPTAASGTVYTAAAGDGGLVYAYAESSGALEWTAGVENGDHSSPAVLPHGVYVAYDCPQAYDFNPSTGKPIWHYSGSCTGGGGSTPVIYDGLLFIGDGFVTSAYDGFILTEDKGKVVGRFHANSTPAFANYRGFFVTGYGATLVAVDVPSMRQIWSATPTGDKYATPPLIVGDTVYIETEGGELYGYASKSGKQKVEMRLGSGGYFGSPVGLGYGSGELFVPDKHTLFALKGS